MEVGVEGSFDRGQACVKDVDALHLVAILEEVAVKANLVQIDFRNL